MTVIVGLVQDGAVHIGGDSAGVDGYDLTVRADQKVFVNGPYLFGFTSSFRMGQLIRYALTPPEPRGDLGKFMVTEFIDAVRDCLKTGGFARKDNDQEEGGCFVVGVAGRLFRIDADYQVGEPLDGYVAAGCGESVALGALYATADHPSPAYRVGLALRAAERFSAGVRGPFTIISQPAADRLGGERLGGEQSGPERPGGEQSGPERPGGEQSGPERPGEERPGAERAGLERPETECPEVECPEVECPETERPETERPETAGAGGSEASRSSAVAGAPGPDRSRNCTVAERDEHQP